MVGLGAQDCSRHLHLAGSFHFRGKGVASSILTNRPAPRIAAVRNHYEQDCGFRESSEDGPAGMDGRGIGNTLTFDQKNGNSPAFSILERHVGVRMGERS